jgi:Fe2+ transport system protein FeoA
MFKRSLRAMNMWQLSANQTGQIKGYSSLISLDQKKRLEDLGFKIDELVICLRKMPLGGPVIYQVQSTAYALEKELAEQVVMDGSVE